MGKRARRREDPAVASAMQQPEAEPTVKSTDRKRPESHVPPAPWGSFPLVELLVLAGMILIVIGFIVQGRQGMAMVLVGMVFGSVAGFEIALREHLAGFRPHSLVLAGTFAAAVLVLTFLLKINYTLMLGIPAAVFLVMSWLMHRLYERRAG